MKAKLTQHLLAAALVCALLRATTSTAAETTTNWSFEVTPYLWAASIDVETSLPATPPSTPPETARFETRISGGAMVAAQARYKSVGLFVDFAWLRLDSEASDPGPAFTAGDGKSDFIHTTAALTYQLPLQGKFHAEVLAGARFWLVNEEVNYTAGALPGFSAAVDKNWVDPMIGVDMRYDFSRRWFASAKGLVGGFGVEAEMAWEVFAGAGYRFTDWGSVTLGYRYLHEEYDRDRFALEADIHGLLLGFGFRF
jgi:opacity protein-like surface antigen